MSLARACYCDDADVVLLDDVLSALDASVASAVFSRVRRPSARVVTLRAAPPLPCSWLLVAWW